MTAGSSTVVCVSAVIFLLVCGGRLVHRQYYGQQDCEMTYMYQWPQYPVSGGAGQAFRSVPSIHNN